MVLKRNAYRVLVGETLRKETVWLVWVWVGGEYRALNTQYGSVWIGLIWLKIGTCGWLW
jgi:hypothetical protein